MNRSAAVGVFAALVALAGVRTEAAELAAKPDSVTFYVVPHQDDWQLFMNPNAYYDAITPGVKVVFVYVTAGDNGCLDGPTGPTDQPYFLARENGAVRSVRFVASTDLPGLKPQNDAGTWDTWTAANGHPIKRYTYRNTVSYFLRLPNPGDGYPCYTANEGSLARLYGADRLAYLGIDGIPPQAPVQTVDGSTTYTNADDLADTIRQIVEHDKGDARNIVVNYQNPDRTQNPNDHIDHTVAGLAAQVAADQVACTRQVQFIDYAISDVPGMGQPLGSNDLINKAAVFATMVSGLVDAGWGTEWDGGSGGHTRWLPFVKFTEIDPATLKKWNGYGCPAY